MIVFISDLHFVDETAGKHNVDARAFELFTEDLAWFLERRKEIKELKVVLLGDIFDVLRTEYWFGVQPDERPWSMSPPASGVLEGHVNTVLSNVIKKSQGQLKALKAGLKVIGEKGTLEPELIYVPGNHDRLLNLYGSSRSRARKALGLGASQMRFDNFFMDLNHGVLARHGHEFDKYNFELTEKFDKDDYDAVPIGDPITTELISRIPVKVSEKVAKSLPGLTAKERERLKANFQQLGNVRPFYATIEWLLYQVEVFPALKQAVEDAIDITVEEFEELPFVKDWMDRHDRWGDIFDEADKIQAVFFLLKKFKCLSFSGLMEKISRLRLRLALEDDHIKGASELFANLDRDFRFVIMGHTHEPLQSPIKRGYAPDNQEIERVYLNTGTWRRRYHRCVKGNGFMAWKDMTYVTIYKPGERDNDVPVFDTWTGRMS